MFFRIFNFITKILLKKSKYTLNLFFKQYIFKKKIFIKHVFIFYFFKSNPWTLYREIKIFIEIEEKDYQKKT